MHKNISGFVGVIVLGMLAPALVFGQTPPVQAVQAPPPVPEAVADGVWLIPGGFLPNRQPDGNTVVFKGPKGLVVIDTGRHRWHRQAILDFARAQNLPIAAIINSHWHLDHVSGNPDLKAAYPQAKVYASNAINDALTGFLQDSAVEAKAFLDAGGVPAETAEDIRNDMAAVAKGDGLKADVVISKSQTINLAGRKLLINYAANAATDGDVWVYDPKTRIAAVGDIVTFPAPFLDTACTRGWATALDQVLASPFLTAIPGHGLPMTREQFTQYRNAFIAFVGCAKSGQTASQCGDGWVRDVTGLLSLNSIDPKRAKGIAGYYVEKVLRPNGGNSKFCKAKG
jgi:glyoxylase-like metal-dependent hydrolase (beta-lactamase superfamily II)